MGSSIIILPPLNDGVSLNPSPETREFVEGCCSPLSSVVVIGESGSEHEEKDVVVKGEDRYWGEAMSDSCDVKPKVESSLQDMGYVGDMDDTYDVGDVGDMDDIHKDVSDALIWSDLRGDHDGGGETCSATQLWLSANNTNHVKRRRVNSEPPLNLASAGLTRPVMIDQLPNLVGVVRDTTWGSDVEGTTPQIRFRGISSCWESEDGSIHVPAPSFESEDVPRMRYNDELLNRIFSKIFEKLDTDNDVLEDLVESRNDQSDVKASIARKIHQLQVRLTYFKFS